MTKNMLDMSLDDIVSENRRNGKRNYTHPQKTVREFDKKPIRGRQWKSRYGDEIPLRSVQASRRGGSNVARNLDQSSRKNWQLKARWLEKPISDRSKGTMVRVSNLDYSILEDDLNELFQAVGTVEKVWVDFDKTDRSKGTGGCIFRDAADAYQAVRMYEGKKIEGMPIHLEVARKSSPRQNWIASKDSFQNSRSRDGVESEPF